MKADDPIKWAEASKNKIPAYCIPKYKGKEFNNAGYLYNWYAVNDPRGLAPQGWLIPGESDAKDLLSEFEYDGVAQIDLKSKTGWGKINLGDTGKIIDGNGTNSYGFSAKPVPYIDKDGEFYFGKISQSYWLKEALSKDLLEENAKVFTIDDRCYRYEIVGEAGISYENMSLGLSVRCLKDPTDHLTENAIAITLKNVLNNMEVSNLTREVKEIVFPYLLRASGL